MFNANNLEPTIDNPIIGWWSGGITSAVAVKIVIDCWGKDKVRPILLDTGNEGQDTYRFKKDCEAWYGKPIETLRNEEYGTIEDVWYKYNSLNVAYGAICSSELKRKVREQFEKENEYCAQVFGFEYGSLKELNRARGMKYNNPNAKPIFPLLKKHITKEDALSIVTNEGIRVPSTYTLGFTNNNCFQTGCVQGGIGYWQKIKREYPDKFDYMAGIEHDLTDRKGEPVTILRNQAKPRRGEPIFLKPHPDYPQYVDISKKRGRKPKPMMECNGFCGSEDLIPPNETSMSDLNLKTET